MACFDEENFVRECKAAMGCKIRASRQNPEQQRDEAVTIVKSLRRCLKATVSKKDALAKAAVQFESEVGQMIAELQLKMQSDLDTTRQQSLDKTKELFRDLRQTFPGGGVRGS